MHPEQPRTGPALQKCRADSSPRGAQHTGLLHSLIQNARPLSFCFLLPTVQAAEVAAAQMSSTPSASSSSSSTSAAAPSASSSSSTSPAATPLSSGSTLPLKMGKPEFADTGWDRLRDLFDRDVTQKYPEEILNVIKSGVAAALAGFLYGGLPAARHARQRYIQVSQAELYTSRADAVRSAHNAAIRGFVRYGWRWSWRVAAFVTLYNSVSTGLSVYRDQYSLAHYAAAGAVTGGLFRLSLGLGGLMAGTIIGAVLGLPTGALILSMQSLGGESVKDRKRRERREQYELRLAEWNARLQLTEEFIRDLDDISTSQGTDEDMQRIQELLNLSQNEALSPDMSQR